MTTLEDHIASYLAAIEIEGKTAKTRASYADSLAAFRKIGRRIGLPDRAEAYEVPHVYAFLAELRAAGASPAYQHRRHREVKACFSWLKRMGVIEVNAFARVPLVKRPLLVKPPFSAADINALLESQDRATRFGARNYALLLFLLDTGVRASECVALQLSEIDWQHRRAFIRHGKGEKQRWVGFGPRTADALSDYLAFRGEASGALFLTARGKAMTGPGTLEVLLSRLGQRAGVAKVHPHRFRHTFATWAIESGAREIDVQMLLGHSDLTMTQRYARTYTSVQAVRAHADLSPVSRLADVLGSPNPGSAGAERVMLRFS